MNCPQCGEPGKRDEWDVAHMEAASCMNTACSVGGFYVFEQTGDPRDTLRAMREVSRQFEEDAEALLELFDILKALPKGEED